jgi:integrase
MARLLAGSASWEGHRLYVLAALCLFDGLRACEALGLRVEDCDPGGRRLSRVGQRRLPVALSGDSAAILAGWLPRCGSPWMLPGVTLRGPWDPNGGHAGNRPRDQLRKAAGSIGLAGVTFEWLRGLHLRCGGRVELGPACRP